MEIGGKVLNMTMFWTELQVLGMHNIKMMPDAEMLGIILNVIHYILYYFENKIKTFKCYNLFRHHNTNVQYIKKMIFILKSAKK